MVWAFLITLLLLILLTVIFIWQLKNIKKVKESIKTTEKALAAERANVARFRTSVEDIKIMEDKRREKNKEIDNTDDNDIAGVLNDLLHNGSSGGG